MPVLILFIVLFVLIALADGLGINPLWFILPVWACVMVVCIRAIIDKEKLKAEKRKTEAAEKALEAAALREGTREHDRGFEQGRAKGYEEGFADAVAGTVKEAWQLELMETYGKDDDPTFESGFAHGRAQGYREGVKDGNAIEIDSILK